MLRIAIDFWGYEKIIEGGGSFGGNANAGYGTVTCEHHSSNIHKNGWGGCIECEYAVKMLDTGDIIILPGFYGDGG